MFVKPFSSVRTLFFLSDRSRVWMCRTVCFGHCFIAAWFLNVWWNSIRSLLKTNDSLNWIELQCRCRGDNRRKELPDFQINVPGLTVQRWIKVNLNSPECKLICAGTELWCHGRKAHVYNEPERWNFACYHTGKFSGADKRSRIPLTVNDYFEIDINA